MAIGLNGIKTGNFFAELSNFFNFKISISETASESSRVLTLVLMRVEHHDYEAEGANMLELKLTQQEGCMPNLEPVRKLEHQILRILVAQM
jgi:hypothetical protein